VLQAEVFYFDDTHFVLRNFGRWIYGVNGQQIGGGFFGRQPVFYRAKQAQPPNKTFCVQNTLYLMLVA
jgi:hypothetical protein